MVDDGVLLGTDDGWLYGVALGVLLGVIDGANDGREYLILTIDNLKPKHLEYLMVSM